MCVGDPPYHCSLHRSWTATKRPETSIVYFPSQDAITASVIPKGINMWGSGLKRKVEEEDSSQQNYFDQRQSILDISMIKLRSQPLRKVEQPLRRSVLIFNTLKHIETELTVEGVRWNFPAKPSLLPALEPNNEDTLDSLPTECSLTDHKVSLGDRFPVSNPKNSVEMLPPGDNKPNLTTATLPAVLSSCSDSNITTQARDLTSSSSSLAVPSMSVEQDSLILSDSRSMEGLFSFPNQQQQQQGPLPTFSSLLDLDSTASPFSSSSAAASSSSSISASSSLHLPITAVTSSSCLPPQHSISRLTTSSSCVSNHQHIPVSAPSVKSSSAHAPMDQDAFNDFDFSALDFDFFSFLPTSLKLPSLSAEDLQSLQPHSESFPPSLTSSCNPKHTDLHCEDLDSIMQILVGI